MEKLDQASLRAAIQKELGSAGLDVLGGRTVGWEVAAAYLGIVPGTLRHWVSKRRVPFLKVGRKTRFRIRDLDDHLNRNMFPAQTD